jgi:hypothetical protein
MRRLRFFLYLAWVVLVATVTLGRVRLDRPRPARIRTKGLIHRLFLTMLSRFRGRRDGRLYIPAEDEKREPAEIHRLKQQADGVLRRIAADWSKGDARLHAEAEAHRHRADAARREIDEHLGVALRAARARTEETQRDLDAEHDFEENRTADERWRMRKSVYVFALAAIFFGELPLNGIAFQLFGEGTAETWIMTIGLAAVLVVCAHGLGVLLRADVLPTKELVLAWMLALLPVVAIVAIGVIRVAYLENLGGTASILSDLGDVTGTVVFGVINLIIYLGAVMLSYLRHDPVTHGIDKLERMHKRAQREVRRTKRQIEHEEHRETWFRTRVSLWKGAIDGAAREARYEAERHRDFFETFMQAYCSSNRVAVERRMRRELKAATKSKRLAKRRKEDDFAAPKLRRNSVSAALTKWPEINMPPDFDDLVARGGGGTDGGGADPAGDASPNGGGPEDTPPVVTTLTDQVRARAKRKPHPKRHAS